MIKLRKRDITLTGFSITETVLTVHLRWDGGNLHWRGGEDVRLPIEGVRYHGALDRVEIDNGVFMMHVVFHALTPTAPGALIPVLYALMKKSAPSSGKPRAPMHRSRCVS